MEKATSAHPERFPNEIIKLTADISLEVYSGEGSLGLELVKVDRAGKSTRINLNAFVSGFSILPDSEGKFQLNVNGRSIHCNFDAIGADPREIFALLHEMGHVITLNKHGRLYEYFVMRNRGVRGAGREVADERRAWAEALCIARKLRDAGYDLFPLFESNEAIAHWLRSRDSLGSYEKALEIAINETKGESILGISVEHSHTPKKNKKYS
ncbi:hypothetical protein HY413_03540 [Candidatus Kaiserbacteria bacterium]|nr:hypothetical protein [Candidatus Kaiserbacteria bacterium]